MIIVVKSTKFMMLTVVDKFYVVHFHSGTHDFKLSISLKHQILYPGRTFHFTSLQTLATTILLSVSNNFSAYFI